MPTSFSQGGLPTLPDVQPAELWECLQELIERLADEGGDFERAYHLDDAETLYNWLTSVRELAKLLWVLRLHGIRRGETPGYRESLARKQVGLPPSPPSARARKVGTEPEEHRLPTRRATTRRGRVATPAP